MTGEAFVFSVLGPLVLFITFMAIPLLGMSMLSMIGKQS